ncbi:MAG TPA: hypothetical protein VGQ53_08280, partial [Chitinophagaceae bacterium]|nr:hypothetical protein [Chitinophagaceae bacterium]
HNVKGLCQPEKFFCSIPGFFESCYRATLCFSYALRFSVVTNHGDTEITKIHREYTNIQFGHFHVLFTIHN